MKKQSLFDAVEAAFSSGRGFAVTCDLQSCKRLIISKFAPFAFDVSNCFRVRQPRLGFFSTNSEFDTPPIRHLEKIILL